MTGGNWASSPLPTLLTMIKSGGTPATSRDEFYGGDIPFVAIEDMTSCGKFLRSTVKTLTRSGLKNSSAWLVPKGAILYSIYATLGVPRINQVPVATNQAILAMICRSDRIHRDFLYYWLDQARGSIVNANASQTTQKNLSSTIVKSFVVRHPTDVPEQSKIAEVLSTVDRAIAQTEALIAKQQRIKTGLMQDLLTRGIDERGQLRTEATHRFKDSSLGRIPVEWEVADIESLLADVDPPMRSGPFGSSLLKEELVESGVPLLGIDNVRREQFVQIYKRFVSPQKAKQLDRYRVRPGDIMITIMGTVGRCCVVPANIGCALSSKHVWTVSLDQSRYSPYVACLQINHSPWVLNHFAQDEQGGIMASIRSETLRSVQLPVPPAGEMVRIEECLRAISEDLRGKDALVDKLSSLKTALMQDLLTGKVRVTPLLEQAEAATA